MSVMLRGSNSSGTSPTLTHREYVDKWLAVSVAVTTFIGFVASVYWERTLGPRLLLRRELALENEIDRLEREADGVCCAAKLYQHSQLMRNAVDLRRELLHERRKRFRYQLTMESMFSPLSTLHSAHRDFSQRNQHSQQAVGASAPLSRRHANASQSAPNSLSPSPVSADDLQPPVHARSVAATEATSCTSIASPTVRHLWDVLRYNCIALVKYVLRFGHIGVYLYVVGLRPGLIAMPPSIENSVRLYLIDVVVPYILGVAMYGPAILFAPRQTLPTNETDAGQTINVSLAMLSSSAASTWRGAGRVTTTAGQGSGAAATVQIITRYHDDRLCASNNLLWWFFCCLCAAHCFVRVFAS